MPRRWSLPAYCLVTIALVASPAIATPIDVEWRYEIPELQTTGGGLIQFDTDDVVGGRVTLGHLTNTVTTPSGSVTDGMDLPWTIDQGDLLGFVFDPDAGKIGFTSIQSFLFVLTPGNPGCVAGWTSCELYGPDSGLITSPTGNGDSQMRVYVIATRSCAGSPGCPGGTQHQGFGFQVPITFQVVPEPGTATLVLLGLTTLGIRARRYRSSTVDTEPCHSSLGTPVA